MERWGLWSRFADLLPRLLPPPVLSERVRRGKAPASNEPPAPKEEERRLQCQLKVGQRGYTRCCGWTEQLSSCEEAFGINRGGTSVDSSKVTSLSNIQRASFYIFPRRWDSAEARPPLYWKRHPAGTRLKVSRGCQQQPWRGLTRSEKLYPLVSDDLKIKYLLC